MKTEIVERKSIKIIGKVLRTTYQNSGEDISKFLDKMCQSDMHSRIPNRVDPNVFYGISIDFGKKNGICSYMLGAEVSSFENLPEDMETRTIPASKYMRVLVNTQDEELFTNIKVDNKDDLGAVVGSVYEYMKSSSKNNIRTDMSEEFEEYDVTKMEQGFYVYVPVK